LPGQVIHVLSVGSFLALEVDLVFFSYLQPFLHS